MKSETVRPRLMCIPAAAIYIGRTEKAIRRMIEKNELPVIRFGRRIQIDIHELDRMIAYKQEPDRRVNV